MIFKIFFVIAGIFLIPAESVPTCAQISSMTTALLTNMTNPNNAVTNLRALALRLGFHDCVGGCNGCINFNNPDNAGLQPAVDVFTSIYYINGFDKIVSLADFFALATYVSITNAVQSSNLQRSGTLTSPCPVPCFSMQWGRTDTANCSNDNSQLPSPKMTGDQMFAYFATQFGFTKNQVVALMGAHSFGTASASNSGYSGKWTGTQNKGLSEVFYSLMINPSITFTNVNVAGTKPPAPPPKWEFKATFADGSNAGFMLNTDFEIFYNLTLDSNAQLTCSLSNTCGLTNSCSNNCPMSSTFSTAYKYSQSCTAFMTDFQSVIMLMLAKGYTNLQQTTCPC